MRTRAVHCWHGARRPPTLRFVLVLLLFAALDRALTVIEDAGVLADLVVGHAVLLQRALTVVDHALVLADAVLFGGTGAAHSTLLLHPRSCAVIVAIAARHTRHRQGGHRAGAQ